MATVDTIRDALNLSNLQLPPSPPVTELNWEEYVDADGEPSLRILLILEESTELDKVRGSDVGELKHQIHNSLLQHGITLFPYIFFAKPSELAEESEGA